MNIVRRALSPARLVGRVSMQETKSDIVQG